MKGLKSEDKKTVFDEEMKTVREEMRSKEVAKIILGINTVN